MKTAIIVGSFNPVTLGHLNIISRASKLFPKLVIGIYETPSKTHTIPASLRLEMLQNSLKDLPNTSAYLFNSLAVDFAKEHDGDVFIRGVRDAGDFAYEADLAQTNYQISEIETLYLHSDPKLKHYRSSWVRDIASKSPEKLSSFIPKRALSMYLDFLNG